MGLVTRHGLMRTQYSINRCHDDDDDDDDDAPMDEARRPSCGKLLWMQRYHDCDITRGSTSTGTLKSGSMAEAAILGFGI